MFSEIEVLVRDFTYNPHAREYASLFETFTEQEIISCEAVEGIVLPHTTKFLCASTQTTAGKTFPTILWFLQDVPPPRNLSILDLHIEIALLRDTCIATHVLPVEQSKSLTKWKTNFEERVWEVIYGLFRGSSEKTWWETHRTLVFDYDVTGKKMTALIRIVDLPLTDT